jgi:spore coat protein A
LAIDNNLPVPIVNHLHGGRTPPSSDGYPTDLILPKQGWPSGHMHDRMASIAKGTREYVYPNDQRAATLWYHDHRMDFTGPQLWRGLAGFYILRDDEEARLPLPSGDEEIVLMICDRSFDADGSFLYPSTDASLARNPGVHHDYMGGVLGDVMLVNGAPWPRLQVANTRYRLRILNASNARNLELTLEPEPKEGPVLLQIGSDGGLLERAVAHRTLPVAPAERFDIIVDFSQYEIGDRITLKNKQVGDSAADIMRFEVVRQEKDDRSIPEKLSDFDRLDPHDAVATRLFDFSYGGMGQVWTINGKPFDPERMDARPKLGSTEVWKLRSDVRHPLHLHLAHFQVLSHAGRPRVSEAGWKDTISMFAGQTASILVKFEGYRGRYVFHCHNLEHEDMAMMGNFEVI